MSAKPETTFIASVHRQFRDGYKPYAMKNHNEYVGGIADVWYSGCWNDVWVEYKFIVMPKRMDTVIDLTAGKKPMLSVLQQAWLRNRFKDGRKVLVVVGHKDGGALFDHPKAWEAPHKSADYLAGLMSRKDIAEHIVAITGSSHAP